MHKKILTAGVFIFAFFLIAGIVFWNRQEALEQKREPASAASSASNSSVSYADQQKGISFEYPKSTWHAFDKGNAVVLLKQSTYPEIESESFALGDQMVVWTGPLADYHNKPTTIDAYMTNELLENAFTGKPTLHTSETKNGIRIERVEHANAGSPHTLDYYFFVSAKAGEKAGQTVYHFSLYPYEPKGTPRDIQNLKDFEALVASAKFTS
ncbi:MAG: hypothetical protein JWO73_94 [Candidatus Taylorbacteria bacterium]|nr:hypothetical protein [Candidatus Taylorbacteria bacterium]